MIINQEVPNYYDDAAADDDDDDDDNSGNAEKFGRKYRREPCRGECDQVKKFKLKKIQMHTEKTFD